MTFLKAFQYFSVAAFLNALLLSFLLLTNRKNHLAKIFMVIMVLSTTFQALLNAFDTRDFFLTYPHLTRISWLIPSLFGPLVYLFTVKLCKPNPILQKIDFLHFVPFTLYLIILSPWFIRSASYKRMYLNNFELAREDDFGFLNQFSIILILAYLILTLVFLRNFRKQISDTFSEISHKRLRWMSLFSYGVLAVLFISALGFYGDKWNIPVVDAIYHYNYVFIVLLVYWIGYKALMQPVIFDITTLNKETADTILPFEDVPTIFEELNTSKYKKSGLDEEQSETLFKKLIWYMKSDKPYLDPEINIFELAGMIGIKKHHLSQVINEKTGMNFFDFINSYRVEEIKQKIKNGSDKNLTLLGLAMESGFNSKATFNNAFKKLAGITPREFQKSLKMQPLENVAQEVTF
jgi:AraC-like DNA-binding protein